MTAFPTFLTLIRAACLAAACIMGNAASGATLLPNGEQTFLDANGRPLHGGSVQFLIPGTTTTKQTWKDSGQTVLNTNPVILDTAGRAIIYGTGAYRQVVKDALGNLIWDQVTGDPSASNSSWGGTSGGSRNAQTVNAPNFSSADGQTISFIAGATNTDAMSLNPNGFGPIAVLKDTSTGPIGMTGGEIVEDNVVTVTYDALRGAFHFEGDAALPGAATTLVGRPTTDLGSIASHFANITGTATIGSFGSSCTRSSPIYYAIFDDASTVSYSAGSLYTPGSTDIQTSKGDSMILDCLGSGNWRVLAYFPASGGIPSSAVMAFNASSCPPGWIPADGTSNTADLRGQFVRGLDKGAGVDPGRTLASKQSDQIQTFTGTVSTPAGDNAVLVDYSSATNVVSFAAGTLRAVTFAGANFGAETRPKNVALLYCQKQ